jgi:predicted phage-related endonuclease
MNLYQQGCSVVPVTCTELQTVSQEELMVLEETLRMIDVLEDRANSIREKIKEEMEKRGLLSVTIGPVRASYVAGSVKHTFDTKKFKEDHADLYKQYQKDTTVKPTVRITVD